MIWGENPLFSESSSCWSFWTGKSFQMLRKLPHCDDHFAMYSCVSLNFIMVQKCWNLRFCNLKTEATNTSMGILEFMAKPDTVGCPAQRTQRGGDDKAQKIDLWAISLRPTYRRANKQSPVGSKFCNRLWTHKHMKHHGTSHYDSGHSNCGDSNTCVTDVSDGAAPSQFPPVDCGSPREEMTGKPSCHWRTGGSLSTPWPFATRMKANLDKLNSDKRNSRV